MSVEDIKKTIIESGILKKYKIDIHKS